MGMTAEAAGPAGPVPLEELEAQIASADRLVTWGTWAIAVGAIVYSLLTGTPFVAAHTPPGWELTAPILPLVVDVAFVITLHADSVVSRHGVDAGRWPTLLRVATGAGSVYLNTWSSVLAHDWVGVATHVIAPGLLVLAAEAGPAWRRAMARKVASARTDARREEERAREAARREEERAREAAQREEDRQRSLRHQEEARQEELAERREARAAERALEARRLDLEATRLELTRTPAPPAPVLTPDAPPARPQAVDQPRPVSVVPRPASASGVSPAPQRPAAPVAAAQPRPAGRIDVAIGAGHQEQPPAGPVADWDLPGLPHDCAPGRRPELLTDTQAHARIRYGHAIGWSQRRVAAFAGRSPSTVHKHVKALEAE
ncbi:helix-turn-helix domain-containing protein [Streptomyces syringium]|uniref:helix-turn-helix domain-containing protein n=1 Tax=Streptomyces syringium TaxID=76729 RepID=UPI0033F8EB75